MLEVVLSALCTIEPLTEDFLCMCSPESVDSGKAHS